MLDDLAIYQKTYDFMLWLHPVVNKFPQNQKFVLGQRIELKILDLIHSMIVANTLRDKSAALQQASTELDELRILIRLSKDLPLGLAEGPGMTERKKKRRIRLFFYRIYIIDDDRKDHRARRACPPKP